MFVAWLLEPHLLVRRGCTVVATLAALSVVAFRFARVMARP